MDENGYIMQEGEKLEENLLITFESADGGRNEYALMGMFVADVFQYMALVPTDPQNTEIVLMPYEEAADGFVAFRDFYSDEEYEKADEAFWEFFAEYQADDYPIDSGDILQKSELQEQDY